MANSKSKKTNLAKSRLEAGAAMPSARVSRTALMLDLPDLHPSRTQANLAPEMASEVMVSVSVQQSSAPMAPAGVQIVRESVQLGLAEADNPQRVLEAALFMSGQAIGAAELAKLVGIAALGHVNEQLSQLSARYQAAGSALEVVQEENGKWVMRVRAAFAPSVRNIAGEAEISRHALKTLAYISKSEGIKKRDLFMKLGSTIYDDVAELLEKGFVTAKPAGRTVSLSTTAKFKQYFQG